jgi:hypothetical protein
MFHAWDVKMAKTAASSGPSRLPGKSLTIPTTVIERQGQALARNEGHGHLADAPGGQHEDPNDQGQEQDVPAVGERPGQQARGARWEHCAQGVDWGMREFRGGILRFAYGPYKDNLS